MRIWRLNFDVDVYENLYAGEHFDYAKIHAKPGKSQKWGWKPIKVVRMYPNENRQLGDAPGFTIPVFSEKAKNALYPLIGKNAEFLPMDFPEATLFAVNVLTILKNAIDLSQSKYNMFPDGRIMWIDMYAFKSDIVKNVHMFKIAEEPKRGVFVSDNFKDIVEHNSLKGFKLQLVWEE